MPHVPLKKLIIQSVRHIIRYAQSTCHVSKYAQSYVGVGLLEKKITRTEFKPKISLGGKP